MNFPEYERLSNYEYPRSMRYAYSSMMSELLFVSFSSLMVLKNRLYVILTIQNQLLKVNGRIFLTGVLAVFVAIFACNASLESF